MAVYILCLLVGYQVVGSLGCARSSTDTTKTTTTPSPVIENVEASNIQGSNAAQTTSEVTVAELRNLSEELYRLDANSVGSRAAVSHQGQTTSIASNDAAPNPLFNNFRADDISNQAETFRLFEALLNNYVADVKVTEDDSRAEIREKNAFLDAVMRTEVMKRMQKFLKEKGFISGNSLRQVLDQIWFTPYSRSGRVLGSSGFEHVFLGEIKKGKVSGLHNWIYFRKEEAERDIDYKGYIKALDLGSKGEILKLRFDWLNHSKDVGSMFIGTSPELEMALYTVCFYARRNAGCNLQMNNQRFRIKVHGHNSQGMTLIGSAYPEIF